ncbi:MAG: hypothetical protein KatS3mg110_1815 [Pirellulaceae bacterium]|nr:MAG: hypothetical protein KatS3mg110_1815 [Pirellulaceae bacterium]
MAARYDIAYRRLFRHRRLVMDLLQGFSGQPWVVELDWTTLAAVRAKFVGSPLRVFEADQIWKVVHQPTGLPVHVLLEFQSRSERWMALRTTNYLLQLMLEWAEDPSAHPGELPATFPMFVYNGRQRWTAARNVHELNPLLPVSLEPFVPRCEYALLDIQATPLHALPPNNTVSYLIRLEQAGQPEEVYGILQELGTWLSAPEDEPIRLAFYEWVVYVTLPEATRRKGPWRKIRNFSEGLTMLAERWQEWQLQWLDKGRREGLKQGRREGLERGRQEGLERGRQEGLERGRQEGLRQGREQGRAEGLLEGERQVLLRQLQRRFGRLSRAARQRIQQADSPQLLVWAERLLTANNLADVFEGDGDE